MKDLDMRALPLLMRKISDEQTNPSSLKTFVFERTHPDAVSGSPLPTRLKYLKTGLCRTYNWWFIITRTTAPRVFRLLFSSDALVYNYFAKSEEFSTPFRWGPAVLNQIQPIPFCIPEPILFQLKTIGNVMAFTGLHLYPEFPNLPLVRLANLGGYYGNLKPFAPGIEQSNPNVKWDLTCYELVLNMSKC